MDGEGGGEEWMEREEGKSRWRGRRGRVDGEGGGEE